MDVLELRAEARVASASAASSIASAASSIASAAGAGKTRLQERTSSATPFSCIASHARCANGQRRLPKKSRPDDSCSLVGASANLRRQSAHSALSMLLAREAATRCTRRAMPARRRVPRGDAARAWRAPFALAALLLKRNGAGIVMLDVRHRSCRCESRLREQCERCQRKRSGERAQLRGGGARSSGGPRRFLGAAHTLSALWLVFSLLPRSCACPAPRAPRLAPAAPPLAWLPRASLRRAPS